MGVLNDGSMALSLLFYQRFQLALEMVLGDRRDPCNVFHWPEVVLNLPGQESYNPSMPRVWKLNPITGRMSASVLSYVDDLRTLGSYETQCWAVCAQSQGKMGVRKDNPPTATGGPKRLRW